MAARAREARPQWGAIGFGGRARIMRRAQRWFFDNADDQSLLMTRRALKREPFMFPYKARQTTLLRSFLKLLYGRGRRD
jgi:hypothetical protein